MNPLRKDILLKKKKTLGNKSISERNSENTIPILEFLITQYQNSKILKHQ